MNKTLLTYCSFVIACLIVIMAFITATTYTQLAVAILLYPILVFFAYKVFPRNWRYLSKKPSASIQPPLQKISPQPAKQAEKFGTGDRESISISDIDKRVFLKLIGTTGIFLFFFSIFNRRAESLFFKNIPQPGMVSLEDISGKKIDPAQNHPTDGYRISEIDDNAITFYGFTNKDGGWFIMKEDSDTGSFRYAKGDSNFPGNWENRENLKYDYFNNIF